MAGRTGSTGRRMPRARSPTTRRSRARKRRAWATGRAIWTTTTRTILLAARRDLVITGPTDTNVGDIQILLFGECSTAHAEALDGESEDRPLGARWSRSSCWAPAGSGARRGGGTPRRASATLSCGCGWPKPEVALARARVDLFELNYGQASRHLQQAEDAHERCRGPARRERRSRRPTPCARRWPKRVEAQQLAASVNTAANERAAEALKSLDRATGASSCKVAHDALPRRHPPADPRSGAAPGLRARADAAAQGPARGARRPSGASSRRSRRTAS